MIRRILSRRNYVIYFAACLLLTIVTQEAGSAVDILGGFTPAQGGSLNVLEIMCWNLGILPPVGAAVLFMEEELGTMRYFTLPRSKSVRRWCLLRFAAIGAVNLSYLLTAEAVSVFCAMMRAGWSGETVKNAVGNAVGNADMRKGCSIIIFLAVFFVHSFMMSSVSAALLAWKGRPQAPLLLFLVVEGCLTIVGNLFPRAGAYLPPYWGMARQARFWAEDGMLYLLWIAGLQAALAAAAVSYVAVRLQDRHKLQSAKGNNKR